MTPTESRLGNLARKLLVFTKNNQRKWEGTADETTFRLLVDSGIIEIQERRKQGLLTPSQLEQHPVEYVLTVLNENNIPTGTFTGAHTEGGGACCTSFTTPPTTRRFGRVSCSTGSTRKSPAWQRRAVGGKRKLGIGRDTMTALLTRPVLAQAWQTAAGRANENGSPRTPAVRPTTGSVVAGGDAGRWEAIIDEVVSMQHLGDDWDGFGAAAPSRELLQSAIGLAYLLKDAGADAPTLALAGTDGSLNLLWHGPDGSYCEVEIDPPLHADVMLLEPGKEPRHWELPNT